MRKIVVVGAMRSGFAYIRLVWQVLGMEVGHEKYLKDGIAAFWLSREDRQQNLKYKALMEDSPVIFHQLRDPLLAISSSLPRIWKYVKGVKKLEVKTYDLDDLRLLEYGVRVWLEYSTKAEKSLPIDITYQVEKVPEILNDLCDLVGVKCNQELCEKVDKIPLNANSSFNRGSKYYAKQFTLNEVENAISEELYTQLVSKAVEYGY